MTENKIHGDGADTPDEGRARILFEMARLHVDRPASRDELNHIWGQIWTAKSRRKSKRPWRILGGLGLLVAGGALAFFGREHLGLRTSSVPEDAPIAIETAPADQDPVSPSGRPANSTPGSCPGRYVDPMQMLALRPDDRSPVHQPWRAWLDTIPASRLLQAPGLTLGDHPINDGTARLIAAAGFRHATVEIGWDHVQAENDSAMKPPHRARHMTTLAALRKAGVRPTILLTGVVGGSPSETAVVLARPAAAGDREIWLAPSSVSRVMPGRTRLRDAGSTIIVTIAADGVATLSRPLSRDLAAGVPYTCLVTQYAPFRRPTLPDGKPDPVFADTIEGWRRFVRTMLAMTRDVAGDDGFDLEVWNIYRGARDFFDVERYFDPAPSDLGPGGPEAAAAAVVAATVEVVRAAGLSKVRIANGFANRAWVSGGVARLEGVDGVTAVGRHVDAHAPGPSPDTIDYHFPEVGLTALGDQPLYRDLSPLRMPGAESALGQGQKVWVTSLSLGVRRRRDIPDDRVGRYKAVMALRGLAAYAHKGAERVVFYQHEPAESFIGDAHTGGPELRESLAQFLAPFRSEASITTPKQLSLETFDFCPDRQDVASATGGSRLGYGDLFAFFPFQISDRRIAAVVYVMSHDPARAVIDPKAFAPARFGLRLAGLSPRVQVSMIDPLSKTPLAQDPIPVRAGDNGSIHIEADVSDAPQILIFDLP